MDTTKQRKRKIGIIILLFSVTYTVSYITRINYSAVISEMEVATGFSKQALSLALTGSFITYGAGQIISGIWGDRFSPKKLVLFGLLLSSIMNCALPFCPSTALMTVVWSVNGFGQALIWPPLVRLMVSLMTSEEYSRGVVRVSWGCNLGTIIVYLLAPLIISISSWKGIFFFAAVCGAIICIAWQSFCPDITKDIEELPKLQTNTPKKKSRLFTPIFFIICIAIIFVGMLRDGVTAWTPSLISESFDFGTSIGILSGAMLPVFGMICYEVALTLYRKKFTNPVICGGVIFSIGLISSVLLLFVLNKSPIVSILALASLNGSMYGVNLMLISMLPAFYAKTGKISTVSGVLNSFVYIGSAASTYGIAVLTENFGWTVTVTVWIGIATLGTVILFASAKSWKNGMEKSI